MESWRQPRHQHDVAEYLEFLTACPWINFQRVVLPWQARASEECGRAQVCDMGQSVPVVLLASVYSELGLGFHLSQDLVFCWHRQQETHAAWTAPSAIILQVGRFHYDRLHGRAIKRRYGVVPSVVLQFPHAMSFCRLPT